MSKKKEFVNKKRPETMKKVNSHKKNKSHPKKVKLKNTDLPIINDLQSKYDNVSFVLKSCINN